MIQDTARDPDHVPASSPKNQRVRPAGPTDIAAGGTLRFAIMAVYLAVGAALLILLVDAFF